MEKEILEGLAVLIGCVGILSGFVMCHIVIKRAEGIDRVE